MVKITKYYTDWCRPCKNIEPHLQKLEQDGIEIERINVGETPVEGIVGVPTLIFTKDGVETHRTSGFKSYNELKEMVESL